jgi:hypothetical protein
MSIPLKQSTAGQVIILPRQLDSTDFNTEETALTIANTDIKLWKAGATTLANKNSGGATHISNGIYYLTLDSTDSSTVGPLLVLVHMAGAMSCQVQCIVYPANVYDSLIAATDKLEVDEVQIASSTTAATRQSNLLQHAINQTAVAASPAPSTTSFAGGLVGASYLDNCFRGGVIVFTSGPNAGLSPRTITSFTSSSGLFVVSPAFTQTPTAGEAFMIVGTSS